MSAIPPKCITSKTPLILGRKKYDRIQGHISKVQEKIADAEHDRQRREYLRSGSAAMTSKWTNILGNIDRDYEESLRKKAEKNSRDVAEFKQIRNDQEAVRQEKITKAELLLKRLKTGPRMLDSAAMQCECIQGNNIYRNIKNEYEKTVKEREKEDNLKFLTQALPWIEEEQKREMLVKKNINEYKKEILKTIQENEKHKLICKKHCDDIAKSAREKLLSEIKEEDDKKRAIKNKKQEQHRKNAFESIKMNEQRQLREKCEEDIDCKINALTMAGKQKIECIKKQQIKKIQKERQEFVEANIKRIGHIFGNEVERKEEERHNKRVKELEIENAAKEQAQYEKLEALRLDRIKQHNDDNERDRKKMNQMTEEYRHDIANRLKNKEINEEFSKMKETERLKRYQANLRILDTQIKEKQRIEKEEKEEQEMDVKCTKLQHDKEDDFFFNYANSLLKDAKSKDRSTYPIEKAVLKYKKAFAIDIQKPVPVHLQSSIHFGIRTPEPMNTPWESNSVASSHRKAPSHSQSRPPSESQSKR